MEGIFPKISTMTSMFTIMTFNLTLKGSFYPIFKVNSQTFKKSKHLFIDNMLFYLEIW